MTKFMKNGSQYTLGADSAIDMRDHLPAGTFTVKWNERGGYFFLEEIEDLTVHGKIYGDAELRADKILNTFDKRAGSTGVLLSGEKGSGKTLLAKMLSIKAAKLGIPTLVINQPWGGDEFNAFMQMINQPTVVIFDEFEKVYNAEDQEKMLTLLDGVYSSKKLFIITCNSRFRINEHMRNRPGRIFYSLNYTGLDNDFITEYCEDNLLNTDHIEAVCRIAVMFGEFNFDMLKAMVEEMNRYDETPQEAMVMLNTKPEQGEAVTYLVALEQFGKPVKAYNAEWHGNPLSKTIDLYYTPNVAAKSKTPAEGFARTFSDDEDDNMVNATFRSTDLVSIDIDSGAFTFVNIQGIKLSLTKKPITTYNYGAY